MLRPQLLLQQSMVSPEIVAHACDGLVLHVFFLFAQAQIDMIRQCHMLSGIGKPGEAAAMALKLSVWVDAQRENSPPSE